MNKKLLVSLTLTAAGVFFTAIAFWLFKIDNIQRGLIIPEIIISDKDPIPTEKIGFFAKSIFFKDREYSYLSKVIEGADAYKLDLIQNFKEKISGTLAKEKYNCDFLVNSGFYSKENEPLGLFISRGKKLRDKENSTLLNGFFYMTNDQDFNISYSSPPLNNVVWEIQSGPLLFIDGNIISGLKIIKDEEARRIAAVKTLGSHQVCTKAPCNYTGDEKLIFIAVFNKSNLLSGPKLGDLPEVISLIAKEEKINISSVLNLDGGSASIFADKGISLLEISHAGSFFCLH